MARGDGVRSRAFTLTELLLTIAIVALLLALLLPVLGRARAHAGATRCLVTLSEQTRASLMFADDHRGRVQIAGRIFVSELDSADELRDLETYIEAGEFTSTVRPLPLQAALAPYLGTAVRTSSRLSLETDLHDVVRMEPFLCSGDAEINTGRVLANRTLSWSAPRVASSYGFNDAVFGIHPASGPRAYGYLRLVTRPSSTLMLADAEPRAQEDGLTPSWLAYFNETDQTTLADCFARTGGGSPSVFPLDRHDGRMNVSFVDGHASPAKIDAPADLQRIGISPGVLDAAD